MPALTRRAFVATAGAVISRAASAPLAIDTHIHLFDPTRFPYAPQATYQPPAAPLEPYTKFVREAGIAHTVIVHPEPYQDDHRYLEYCFAHEPSPGFFKGTCLFDPIAPETPARMEALVKKHPGRIVALRIHEVREPGKPALTSGPIKDRDLAAPAMARTWSAATALGLAIQMHFIPYYSPQIEGLVKQFPKTTVVLDHLGRAGQGSAADADALFRLARSPLVYMKYSGVNYSSKQKYPFADAKPIVRRAYEAFGPERIIWGGLGQTMNEYREQSALLDAMFDYAPATARARIRGANAKQLYGFA